MRALGIDVGVRRGLDLVLLDAARVPRGAWRGVTLETLGSKIEEAAPDLVAIDAPMDWARRGRSRQTERELRLFGIQSYGTPTRSRARANPFYDWVRAGIRSYSVAEDAGFPRYAGGAPRGTAIEVFPHASAVVLAGCLPPAGARKAEWRARVLEDRGVATRGLKGIDQLDAALAALTGLMALEGERSSLGDPTEGAIVLPARSLPPPPYGRCDDGSPPREQRRLPGMTPCACKQPGCDRLTAREFAPGHDAKRKSALWRAARAGLDATTELRRRGWELPPEMR